VAEVGGEIRCRAEVTNILVGSGGVSGVRLATGEEISGREVIVTLNPVRLPEMLPAGVLRPAYLKRLKVLRQTLSAYILFGRSRGCLDQLSGRNLFLAPRPGVFQAAVDQPLGQRGCYLAAANGAGDERGRGVIGIIPANFSEVAAYEVAAKQRVSAYKGKKAELAEEMKELFVSGCPQLSDLEVLDLATPLTLQDYSSAPQGAIYGVGRYLGQYNPQSVTRLPGLFLSGQATAAPGLMGAVVAAYITCGSILGHELLRGEIKRCR
jgi:all-trans-retinol 13,14-reductase